MIVKDYIALGAFVLSLLSFLYSHYNKKSDIINNLRDRLITLETKMEIFWKNVSIGAAGILHSPHPENARTDFLLEQLRDGKITINEERELIEWLEKLLKEKKETDKLQAANSLLAILKAKNYVK